MNDYQKLSPKYWVGHNKATDDVFIETAEKSYEWAMDKMELKFGDEFYENPNLEIILVEIKQV